MEREAEAGEAWKLKGEVEQCQRHMQFMERSAHDSVQLMTQSLSDAQQALLVAREEVGSLKSDKLITEGKLAE
jgi:hypothetical protein